MSLGLQSNLLLALVGVALFSVSLWRPVSSHGRLVDPPARSTMWRYGFNTPRNYNDHELFCGGFSYQVSQGYKCGLCGDAWGVKPRPHEAGGQYATGTIAGTYTQGQEMDIVVELTANHKGWFEFKICPTNDLLGNATQECLDLYPLDLTDGSGTKFGVTGLGSQPITINVVLPPFLHCDLCVLQWHYHTGNSWGTDPNGHACIGCGYQEEFYGCSDIKILPSGTTETTQQSTAWESSSSSHITSAPTSNPTTTATATTSAATTNIPTTTTHTGSCFSANQPDYPCYYDCTASLFVPGLQEWCNTNCNLDYCPQTHCECELKPEPRASTLPVGCYAKTPFLNWPGMNDWCGNNCVGGSCRGATNMRCFCVY